MPKPVKYCCLSECFPNSREWSKQKISVRFSFTAFPGRPGYSVALRTRSARRDEQGAARTMTPADLRVHIRQLCCLGLPGEQLVPPLLKAVRQLVGADSAGFFWVDAEGDMTSLYAERLLPPSVMRLYFERYYESDESSFRRSFT